jgi:hypothetical protein
MTFESSGDDCRVDTFGASGFADEETDAINPWRSSSEASATIPNPPPARRKNPRRELSEKNPALALGPGQVFIPFSKQAAFTLCTRNHSN